jgi:hypothetical protein
VLDIVGEANTDVVLVLTDFLLGSITLAESLDGSTFDTSTSLLVTDEGSVTVTDFDGFGVVVGLVTGIAFFAHDRSSTLLVFGGAVQRGPFAGLTTDLLFDTTGFACFGFFQADVEGVLTATTGDTNFTGVTGTVLLTVFEAKTFSVTLVQDQTGSFCHTSLSTSLGVTLFANFRASFTTISHTLAVFADFASGTFVVVGTLNAIFDAFAVLTLLAGSTVGFVFAASVFFDTFAVFALFAGSTVGVAFTTSVFFDTLVVFALFVSATSGVTTSAFLDTLVVFALFVGTTSGVTTSGSFLLTLAVFALFAISTVAVSGAGTSGFGNTLVTTGRVSFTDRLGRVLTIRVFGTFVGRATTDPGEAGQQQHATECHRQTQGTSHSFAPCFTSHRGLRVAEETPNKKRGFGVFFCCIFRIRCQRGACPTAKQLTELSQSTGNCKF